MTEAGAKPGRDERGRIRDPELARAIGKLGGRPPKPPPLGFVRTESHTADVMAGYALIEERLVAAGFPPTSPWWQSRFLDWYLTDKPQMVFRVGRRGGKSSSLCRLAVAEALFGHHKVPPGDTGFVAIVSANRDEAQGRLRTIKEILSVLGVKYEPVPGMSNASQIDEGRVGFRVFPASIAGVSGFTSIMVICDELAKWRDADTGANPATIVLQSVRPTMQTQPNARIALSSSPMGRWDAHYDAFEQGENDFQATAYAPTWEANPTVTEEATRRLEPDELAWSREYRAFPADEMLESIFTGAELDGVTRDGPPDLPPVPGYSYGAAIDPATRGNAWTLAVCTVRVDAAGQVIRSVVFTKEWRGSRARPLLPRETLAEISTDLIPYGVDTVWSDQASGDALRQLAADVGLTLVVEPWTHVNKHEAWANVATWVRTRTVELPKKAAVRQDLLGVRRKITRNGMTIDYVTTPDGRHSDFAPVIAMALSRSIAPPVVPEPELGTAAWEKREEQRRIDEYMDAQKPLHQRVNLADRGASAFWRRGR